MEKERKSFENLQSDTDRAFKVLNERRIVIQGAQDYSIPQSHLADMHMEVHVQQKEIEALEEPNLKVKAEPQRALDELAQQELEAGSTLAIAVQRHEATAAQAELQSERDESNKKREEEVKKLKEE